MGISDENVRLLAFVCRAIAWCFAISLLIIWLCGCGKTYRIRTGAAIAGGAVQGAVSLTLTQTQADTAWIHKITKDGWIIVRYE